MRPLEDNNITIIVFPPGCGGNHLANLLSLHEKFQCRFNSDNYQEDLLTQYSQSRFNYHMGPLENLRNVDWPATRSYFKSNIGIPIICSHATEYYGFLEFKQKRDVFLEWSSRNIILFKFPNEESIPFKRFYNLRHGEGVGSVMTMETYKTYYTPEVFDLDLSKNRFMLKFTGYKSYLNDIVRFDTEKYMDKYGFDYVHSFCLDTYGIDLPSFGEKLHKIWYTKLVTQIY